MEPSQMGDWSWDEMASLRSPPPEAPFPSSCSLERTERVDPPLPLFLRPSSHCCRQSWVVALDSGREAAGPHVTWGGLGDSVGEVLLQPSGVRQPAVSK